MNPGPASYDANMTPVILECPSCRGSGRDPDALAAIADDNGTCLTCCRPDHPWYVARHGQVGVPLLSLADPALADVLARLAEQATFLPAAA